MRSRLGTTEQKEETLADQVLKRTESVVADEDDDLPVRKYLSTGCAVLNCSISGRVNLGWPMGRVVQIIGDSDTCKSALADTGLAEAAMDASFSEYRLIDMDIENARTRNNLFGETYQRRVEHWSPGGEKYPAPETIEELHFRLLNLFEEKKPFVGVVDSLDFLPSKQELAETQESWENWKKGKADAAGSYRLSKQKYSKKFLGEIKGLIGQTESLLLFVSQTYDNIGFGFAPKVVAGGHAWEFAARIRGWISQTGTVDKVRDRAIGKLVRWKCSKNHITFKKRDVSLWVYEDIGIDDIRTTIEFLTTEKHWKKDSGRVEAKEFEKNYHVKDLIKYIEQENLENKLNNILQRVWNQIESDLSQDRKRRYS